MYRNIFSAFLVTLAMTLSAAVPGCQKKEADNDSHHENENGEDRHAQEGPHGGSLIELGKEHKYHAELVHDDDDQKVTIYILGEEQDGEVPDPIAIDAKEVTINITIDNKAVQYKLKAEPDDNDAEGKSSRFVSTEKELGEDLDAEGADAHLVVLIDGKTYRGKIEHDHNH